MPPFVHITMGGKDCLQLTPKRPVQQRLEQMLRLALDFALLGAQVVGQTLRV